MRQADNRIRQFIVDNLLFGDESSKFSNDDSLLELGIIDSTGVLELVMFIETEYRIKIKDSELIPSNLDSVKRLARFIESKIQMSASGVTSAG